MLQNPVEDDFEEEDEDQNNFSLSASDGGRDVEISAEDKDKNALPMLSSSTLDEDGLPVVEELDLESLGIHLPDHLDGVLFESTSSSSRPDLNSSFTSVSAAGIPPGLIDAPSAGGMAGILTPILNRTFSTDWSARKGSIDEFFDAFDKELRKQHALIERVFPTPLLVLEKLIRALFDLPMAGFLASLLNSTADIDLYLDTLVYLMKKVNCCAYPSFLSTYDNSAKYWRRFCENGYLP